jgi:hypothetical protein
MGGGVVTGLHSGGIAGTDATFRRLVDMNMFMSAPKYHSGLMPGEMPAILKKDEGVFTPAQMRALGSSSGGSKVEVNIINNAKAETSVKETKTQNGMRLDVMVEDIYLNPLGPVGRLAIVTAMKLHIGARNERNLANNFTADLS